jgi:hypothetical protein
LTAADSGRAQQTEQTRRIGVLIGIGQDDLGSQARYAAFLQALQQPGWSEGRNMRIETRWAAGDANRLRKHADELVALAPDVILTVGSVSVGQRSSAYPVPYALETDWPVGAGGLEPPHQESCAIAPTAIVRRKEWQQIVRRTPSRRVHDPRLELEGQLIGVAAGAGASGR